MRIAFGKINAVAAWLSLAIVDSTLAQNVFSTAASAATFIKRDADTIGNWKGVYGAEGYHIINDTNNYPVCVSVLPTHNLEWTYHTSTEDVRALQKATSANDRIAAQWYRWSDDFFTINFNFTDGKPHQFALYCVDWDHKTPLVQKIEVLDTLSRKTLDTQLVTSFTNGVYLVWNLQGNVTVKISQVEGDDSVISGFFFDKPAPTPVKAATQNNSAIPPKKTNE